MAHPNDKSILVVEDEPDVRNYLVATLEDAGFRVRSAANGLEAYNQVKEAIPDAITLDLVMPRQSGVLFYRRLRKNSRFQSIPVLIITAHARDDLAHDDFRELMQGVDAPPPEGFLEKPVAPATLLSRLAGLLDVELDEDPHDAARGEIADKLLVADEETLRRVRALLESK